MKIEKICVLGGSGFVGGHLVTRLANSGRQVKILTRHPERHRKFTVMPGVKLLEADVFDDQVLREQFADCDAVINLVGILNGSEQQFHRVHAELPARVADACVEGKVRRLLHMSALNADADHGPSVYLRTKGEGERAAHRAGEQGLQVTSFCPSVIFGPDDSFFNRFALLLKLSPVLPLACPEARFAPVYVGDVVQAFENALENSASFAQHYQLCGPEIFTLKQLVDYTARLLGRKRLVVGLPDNLSRLQAKILQYVPGQPFTMDNYQSMQRDSVCQQNGLAALGITPTSTETIMPQHFAGTSKSARYNTLRKGSRR